MKFKLSHLSPCYYKVYESPAASLSSPVSELESSTAQWFPVDCREIVLNSCS